MKKKISIIILILMGGIVSNIVYKVDDNKFKKISLAKKR